MTRLHPLTTTAHIRDTYLRYLKTIYPFRDQQLRDAFVKALTEPERLIKGPLLEASPPFEQGRTIQQLIADGILHPLFAQVCSDALPLSRPLHLHQDRAVVHTVQQGRNLIVATGTGSGKTESFLVPVLNSLLCEQAAGTLSQPGVRALLLYPMNALANDQLKRLRRVLDGYESITFGRYIGETEEEQSNARDRFYEQFPGEKLLLNELISRKQMRAAPPHILLTNYAMLEYLLLRPEDCEFFDGPTGRHWRFIVLDEAHIYDGASGIEIAMLLRRLKERIVSGQQGRLQCIATSATLGRGLPDFPFAVEFASKLFGESFEWDANDPTHRDVVQAARIPVHALGAVWGSGTPGLYQDVREALRSLETQAHSLDGAVGVLADCIMSEIPASVVAEAINAAHHCYQHVLDQGQEASAALPQAIDAFLFAWLRGDAHLRELRQLLNDRPTLITIAAATIFPETAAADRLIDLIDLAVRARPERDALALLPARYHLFARALEGAFACLNVHGHDDHRPRVFLSRYEECPECGKHVVELASCARCGATYIIGRAIPSDFEDDDAPLILNQLTGNTQDAQEHQVALLMSTGVGSDDEDELVVAGDEPGDEYTHDPYTLCLNCGTLTEGNGCRCTCDTEAIPLPLIMAPKEFAEPKACIQCGARSSGGVVYRFLTGQDAPVSVLATALYQHLPASRDTRSANLPGEGRKLLIFSDSRQDAAFFAPYLERTYNHVLQRRLILKMLQDDDDGRNGDLRLQDAVAPLRKQAERAGIFTQRQSAIDRRRVVNTWLMQELVAIDRRLSLEGLGMLQFRLVRPERWRSLKALQQAPWNLQEEETWTLVAMLIDTLRQQGVTTFPDDVDPRDDAFLPRAKLLYVCGEKSDAKAGILSWVPVRGRNRRFNIVDQLLKHLNPAIEQQERYRFVRDALKGIWSDLVDARSSWRDHLVSRNLDRNGIAYQLSHEFWQLVPFGTAKAWYCEECRTITFLNLRDRCLASGCQSPLIPLPQDGGSLRDNHYHALYRTMTPIALSAEEHTAQWTSEEAGKIQERFVNGELNILSCSTTFELGVDVGDLQTVLMRNVPPTTANYIQRAGRAGRRTDSAAFVLTYAQRRSHDLTYYSEPHRIVAGKISPPRFSLANAKIARRHMQATLIAAFFRTVRERDGRLFRNVGDFFQPTGGLPSGTELLKGYIDSRPAYILASLRRSVPPEICTEVGLETWGWLRTPDQDGMIDLLERVHAEVVNDLDYYEQLEREAAQQGLYKQSIHYQRVRNTIRGRSLLGFMASRNLLPKYGFPTDVVELKTAHLTIPEAAKIELQRDLRMAIAEYAPGAQIVAAKRVWKGGGIYQRPMKSLPEYHYAICPSCGYFHVHPQSVPQTCQICNMELFARPGKHGRFIKPEFGFIAVDGKHTPGEKRPQRLYSSRVYFAEYATSTQPGAMAVPDLELVNAVSGPHIQIEQRYSRFGRMVLVNSGPNDRGFEICRSCGFAQIAPQLGGVRRLRNAKSPTHKDPRTGRDCAAVTLTAHLGHEFLTDVVELRFSGASAGSHHTELWRSLVYALLEGAAQGLGIRRDDLDGTLYWYNSSAAPAVVLYDNVPGGAGHVHYIAQELPTVIVSAYQRVKHDCCGPETSCYECLRNFRNQPYHEDLRRGLVRDFLAIVAGQIITK